MCLRYGTIRVRRLTMEKHIKRIFIAIFILLLALSFFLGSWYVRHGDVHFPSDIARDFFIFEEIQAKGIVLIGGRTSSNIFHGPLWQYINMPGYLLGGGNPIVVGWYWLFLTGLSLTAGFSIARNLFNSFTAYVYVVILSLSYVFQVSGFINPHGAMLTIVIFFYAFIRYIQTYKLRYLILYAVVVAAIIQFEVAVGGPLLLLSLPVIIFKSIRKKKKKNLVALLIILLGLSNYILFDLRHDLLLVKKAIEYISIKNYTTPYTYGTWIQDRITFMLFKIDFLKNGGMYYNIIFSFLFFILLLTQVKNKKYGLYYRYFLYFYIGFILLSFLNQGNLLSFYIYPWLPLLFLILTSFVASKYKVITLIILGTIYVLNVQTAISDLQHATNYIGKSKDSWKFLSSMAQETFSQKENDVGFFAYTPDTLGYAIKYATRYTARQLKGKKVYFLTKKPITYLFVEPPPGNNPYMLEGWWIENKMRITKKPIAIKEYANGYKVETFALTEEEVKAPTDSIIDPGLHFR